MKEVSLSESGRPSDVWTAAQLSHPVSLVSQFNKPYVVCKFVRDMADFLLYSCGGLSVSKAGYMLITSKISGS